MSPLGRLQGSSLVASPPGEATKPNALHGGNTFDHAGGASELYAETMASLKDAGVPEEEVAYSTGTVKKRHDGGATGRTNRARMAHEQISPRTDAGAKKRHEWTHESTHESRTNRARANFSAKRTRHSHRNGRTRGMEK